MIFPYVFLACSLFGAFCIGLLSAWLSGRSQRRSLTEANQLLQQRLDHHQEDLERMRGHLDALRERLATGVDPSRHQALQERLDQLQAAYDDMQERQALGLQAMREDDEKLRFMESFGVSITGEVPPEERDDLTQVRGISPYIADRLYTIGIRTFEQLGRLNSEEVRRVNEAIELLPGRIRREDWVGQCQRLSLSRRGA
jgi:predicted flap endonuclease-1-like 5' DNA nuclease